MGKNRKNVVINSISDGRNSQSKEEKSKVENNNKKQCNAEANALFERMWELYLLKRRKGQVSETQKSKLLKIGFEELEEPSHAIVNM